MHFFVYGYLTNSIEWNFAHFEDVLFYSDMVCAVDKAGGNGMATACPQYKLEK